MPDLPPPALITTGTVEFKRLCAAMVMAGFSTFSLLYGVQSLLPLLADHFDVGPATASLAISVATGAMAFAILLASGVSDRLGRRRVMISALFAAAVFNLAAAAAPGWTAFLAMRLLCGLSLAGVPAVAMAYVGEEVEPPAIGPAMGVYIAGSALGGLIGRVGIALVADWLDWRAGVAVMGGFSVLAAALFAVYSPRSKGFVSRRHDLATQMQDVRALFADPAQRLLYLEGFLLMGSFVTLYNYVGFRLSLAPYDLPPRAVGLIFLLYLLGSASSTWTGRLAGRLGFRAVFAWPIILLLVGIGLTMFTPLWIVILGLGVITIGFFGAHTVASGWVSRRAYDRRAQAGAIYLFIYYIGSSLLGWLGGIAWGRVGWPGVALFTAVLCALALAVAFVLVRIPLLADPRQPPAPP